QPRAGVLLQPLPADDDTRLPRDDPLEQLPAGAAADVGIEQDEIGPLLCDELLGLPHLTGAQRLVAGLLELPTQPRQQHHIVVYQEDRGHSTRILPRIEAYASSIANG